MPLTLDRTKERKEAIDQVMKRILVDEFKHCAIDDAVFIGIWLRGMYKAGMSQFFSPFRLISLEETIRHNAVIRKFAIGTHQRYLAIRPKAHDSHYALQDVLVFEGKLSTEDTRSAEEFIRKEAWVTSMYHATRLSAQATSGRTFMEYIRSASQSFTLTKQSRLA